MRQPDQHIGAPHPRREPSEPVAHRREPDSKRHAAIAALAVTANRVRIEVSDNVNVRLTRHRTRRKSGGTGVERARTRSGFEDCALTAHDNRCLQDPDAVGRKTASVVPITALDAP